MKKNKYLMNIENENKTFQDPKPLNEGLLLRALIAFYKGTAGEFAEEMGINRNQWNYLIRQSVFSAKEKEAIIEILRNKEKWHEGSKDLQVLFIQGSSKSKKINNNVGSQSGNKLKKSSLAGRDSTVSDSNYSDQEINRLIRIEKEKQARINELKIELKKEQEERRQILKAFQELSGKFADLSAKIIDKID